jgi:hypothetical protein
MAQKREIIMGYIITPYNKEGVPTDLQITSKLPKAKKIGARSKAPKVRIDQIRGGWKRDGKFLLGIRELSGNYKWEIQKCGLLSNS